MPRGKKVKIKITVGDEKSTMVDEFLYGKGRSMVPGIQVHTLKGWKVSKLEKSG